MKVGADEKLDLILSELMDVKVEIKEIKDELKDIKGEIKEIKEDISEINSKLDVHERKLDTIMVLTAKNTEHIKALEKSYHKLEIDVDITKRAIFNS